MLLGKNLYLRALEPEDIDLLYKWENNTDIWMLSNTLVPFSRKVLTDYLTNAQFDIYTTKQLRMVICLTDATAIGCIDLFDFDPKNLRAGVGILISDVSDRNKGYASEALEILKIYSREKLNLHQLYCSIATTNTASIKLFEKLDFLKSGTKKEWLKSGNGFLDECFYQCIL